MVGDVAATPGLEEAHALRGQRRLAFEHMRAIVPGLDAERDDGRVLEQEQLVANHAVLALRDERRLEIQRGLVVDRTQAADFERHIQASSKVSSRSLMKARNRPASAPSMSRWS